MIRLMNQNPQEMTQRRLSDDLGVSQSCVSEYIRKLKHVGVVGKDGSKWILGRNYRKYLKHRGIEEQG